MSRPLTGLAGKMVFLKLSFGSDSTNQRDGFALDDVWVVPGKVYIN